MGQKTAWTTNYYCPFCKSGEVFVFLAQWSKKPVKAKYDWFCDKCDQAGSWPPVRKPMNVIFER